MMCHLNQALKDSESLETGQERDGGLANRHFRERQQCEHRRSETLSGMNGEYLGWLDGAQMYEREQRKSKLGKVDRG